jgi:hypothetical protein
MSLDKHKPIKEIIDTACDKQFVLLKKLIAFFIIHQLLKFI